MRVSLSSCAVLAFALSLAGAGLACASSPDSGRGVEAPEHEHGHGHEGGHGHDHEGGDMHDHEGGDTHDHEGGDMHEGGHAHGNHRFEDPAEWAERFDSPEREAWQRPDEIVARLQLAPDALVADLGAGTGYFAARLAAAAPEGRVFAVDIEPGMVEWLRERGEREGLENLEAVQGEALDPKLPEAVDLAFMCNVFHHIEDPQRYFEVVAKRLRPGARVAIVDYRKQLPEGTQGPPEAMRLTHAQIEAVMVAAGYVVVERELELLERQYLLVFERA